tara:strand:+ start:66646 stop:66909 length:264 start_codon:yes stop_codon:yes gene_type:complete
VAEITQQLSDYRLTTARIIYHLPDFHDILQEYIWQDYDLAPRYPNLKNFLTFWTNEIEGKLHSVYVARKQIITAGDYRFAEWQGTVQ